MIRVFVSQPMNNLPEDIIAENRTKAIDTVINLLGSNACVLNSCFVDYKPKTGNIGLGYLARSIDVLADADIAFFCKGWNQARGCRIEHECARAYGITIIEE